MHWLVLAFGVEPSAYPFAFSVGSGASHRATFQVAKTPFGTFVAVVSAAIFVVLPRVDWASGIWSLLWLFDSARTFGNRLVFETS
jgi:hypothetical protein